MKIFGKQLEYYRKKVEMSQAQAARISGFSRSFISKMESGEKAPSVDAQRIEKLIRSMNLEPAQYQKLWNLYLKERPSKVDYKTTQAIFDFIASFGRRNTLMEKISRGGVRGLSARS